MKRLMIFSVVIALIALAGQASADLTDGLVGYWKADGTAEDASGNGNHGILNGISYIAGKYGLAFNSPDRGRYVYVPDSPSLRFPDNAITIAAWINLSSVSGHQPIVFKRSDGSPWEGFELRIAPGAPHGGPFLHGFIRVDLMYDDSYYCPYSSTTVSANTWTHIAATYSNYAVKIYQDGVLVGSTVIANSPILDTTQPLYIGSPGKWWENRHQRAIDEVRIYSRALSECEMGELAGTGSCNQAPIVSAAAPSVATIWPPNNKMVDITIEGVTDPDGDAVTITIDGITNEETGEEDANGIGTSTAQVRAARNGKGDGRVYEISFTASDGQATSSGTVIVTVPHDQGKGQKKGRSKPVVGSESASWGAIKESVK